MNSEGTCWSGVLGQGLYPPLILSRIHRHKLTGELHLSKAVSRLTFYFESGNLLQCASAHLGDKTALREAVNEVFSWGEGTFSFLKIPTGDPVTGPGRLSTPELILGGVRTIKNLYLVEEALGRSEGLVRLAENPSQDFGYQFSPLESFLLSRLTGTSTVEELCLLSPVTRSETLCGIYVLLCAGVLDGGGDPLRQQLAGPVEDRPVRAVRSFAELGPTRPPVVFHPSFRRSRQRITPKQGTIGLPSNNDWMEEAVAVYDVTLPDPVVPEIQEESEPADSLDMARYHFEKGLEHYANEDYHSAVQLFKLAVKIDDDQAEYHRHLALALSRNPKWGRKAEQSLLRAVALEPDHAETHYFLGRIYLASGLPSRAMARFRESLRIDPDLKPARLELAVINGAARETDRDPVSVDLLGRK